MVANTVEEFNPRDFSTCSTPRYVIISIKTCVGSANPFFDGHSFGHYFFEKHVDC